MSRCSPLTGPLAQQLLDSVDSVLFDCDGVLWRGEQPVPGAARVVRLLRRAGKKVLFLTNNSTKTRQMYADKLGSLGFDAEPDDVFGTAFCCAAFLRAQCGLRGDKVFLLGGDAMRAELEAAGLRAVGVGPDPLDPPDGKQLDWARVPLDPEVRAVVVGFDQHFSYMKLNRAMQYLTRTDCLFVGTNRDTRLPLEDGEAVPGTGCLLQAVEAAAQRQAQTVGKPGRFMFDCAARRFGLRPERCLMVGDRLDTDILLGSACGLKTLLTLTGVSGAAEAAAHRDSGSAERRALVPDFYVETVADLLPALLGHDEPPAGPAPCDTDRPPC